jgi:predicted ATP-dependent serine protease
MTDVKFLDNQYIVVAHRFSCKIYTIHIDETNQSFTIIDSIQLIHKNKPYQTESFTILNNTIYM